MYQIGAIVRTFCKIKRKQYMSKVTTGLYRNFVGCYGCCTLITLATDDTALDYIQKSNRAWIRSCFLPSNIAKGRTCWPCLLLRR